MQYVGKKVRHEGKGSTAWREEKRSRAWRHRKYGTRISIKIRHRQHQALGEYSCTKSHLHFKFILSLLSSYWHTFSSCDLTRHFSYDYSLKILYFHHLSYYLRLVLTDLLHLTLVPCHIPRCPALWTYVLWIYTFLFILTVTCDIPYVFRSYRSFPFLPAIVFGFLQLTYLANSDVL